MTSNLIFTLTTWETTMYKFGLTTAILLLIPAAAFAAAGVERWSATSTTAMAITGDITLSPTRLVANGKVFPLVVAADVTDFASTTGPQAARILRVTKPVNPVLRNGNRLCGSPVRWIAVYRTDRGRNLNLSAFSGVRRPTGETGTGTCGTFLYSR
ncbi:MAG: hypothetical protein J0I47_14405 [Sphingomonas sp.]|uniref:hypothetical protein n=1 Tax=Sphingomonas sp. TaxID=28214 RepID=UPI001AD4206C|nr:hypothetical protein [Sphingomonas sp.]MBN8809410.1 hypothetical protein [Sphingomonas sp.]